MELDEGTARRRGGGRFHPEAVRQRLDLSGDAKVCVPMIVDLARRDYTWTDLNTSASGGFHNVWRHRDRIGTLAADVAEHFAEGSRAPLWDLACACAAARTDEVLVRDRAGGVVSSYRRAAAEPVAAFAARLRDRRAPDATETGPAGDTARALAGRLDRRRVFTALVHADLPAPAEVSGALYRLYPGPLDAAPGTLERLTAGDVVALFNPEE
ncbi:hypothetical protein [Kitasatospora sp. NPDC091207]|uniref:hypothetical protein n=1 Tax=Kitasatospora sp. NPDC091207 TaxID=3364083 RepID=UPI003821742F